MRRIRAVSMSESSASSPTTDGIRTISWVRRIASSVSTTSRPPSRGAVLMMVLLDVARSWGRGGRPGGVAVRCRHRGEGLDGRRALAAEREDAHAVETLLAQPRELGGGGLRGAGERHAPDEVVVDERRGRRGLLELAPAVDLAHA